MSHALDNPALVASLAMFVGVVAQIVARHVAVPGVVLLLVAGVALGPDGADLIRPEALGAGLEGLVGFAVAIILFEGGLNLDVRVLRRQQTAIRRLVLGGSVITALGGTVAAHFLLGWDWRRALLFGTLVIVTGPTVITPILRRIHVRHSVETILEAEGIFIDAVGATIAVVALEVLLAPPETRFVTAALGIVSRFGVGTLVGASGGLAFALLMRFRSAIPEGMANIAALATAVTLFEISNAITPESGITAAILAGMVVGHTQSHDIGDLRNFKEQLTVLLVATLFVLLAANVRVSDVRDLGMPGALTVVALIFVVRPLNVVASTRGTELDWREKAFLSWLAPRGIVAAAVSSLFAERMAHAGIEGGAAMRALVFLVIATTVVAQGMSAGVIASLLGLRVPRDVGYVILGADEVARMLGAALATGGEEVVLIDTHAGSVRAAEEAGFKVVFGDGLDERSLLKARVSTRRGCIGATTNESINFLFCQKVHETERDVATYVAIERKESGVSPAMVTQNRSEVLFAGAAELEQWHAVVAKKKTIPLRFRATAAAVRPKEPLEALPAGTTLILAVTRRRIVRPLVRPYAPKKHDVLHVVVVTDQETVVVEWLEANGWVRVMESTARSTR